MAQWKQALGAVCWACVGLCLYWAEFGEVFFLLSLIIGIWISLDKSHQRTGRVYFRVANLWKDQVLTMYSIKVGKNWLAHLPLQQNSLCLALLWPQGKACTGIIKFVASTKPTKLYTAPEVFEDNKKRPKYTGKKVPRNSPCPCGSRMKYSKCCGNASLKNITYDDLSLSDSE